MPSFDDIAAAMAQDVETHLGSPAAFTPSGGDAVSCRVIVSAPDVMAGLGDARAVVGDYRIEVSVAAVAPHTPRKNDTFVVGAKTYRCVDKARRREDDALFFTVDVEVAG